MARKVSRPAKKKTTAKKHAKKKGSAKKVAKSQIRKIKPVKKTIRAVMKSARWKTTGAKKAGKGIVRRAVEAIAQGAAQMPDPTEKVPLGRSGLAVSRICFGLAPLGNMPDTYGYNVEPERARETVRAVFDSAVNFLDTSRNYGFGRSEERIGEVIRERGGIPKDFVISSKLDRDMETNGFDGARARRSLEESLKTLNVDRIQLLHVHKEEGLADAVGLAAGRVDIMMPMMRDWDFDAIITHNRFTLANRNAEEMMDLARARGKAVLNAAPYAGGVLAKGSASHTRYVYQEASEEMLEPIAKIERVCAKHGLPPGAAALQFSMQDKRVTSTVCGISKPERITQTLEWARHPISEAAWADLLSLPFESGDPEATRAYRPG